MLVNHSCAITKSATGLILASVVVTLGCDSFASFLRTLASWPGSTGKGTAQGGGGSFKDRKHIGNIN